MLEKENVVLQMYSDACKKEVCKDKKTILTSLQRRYILYADKPADDKYYINALKMLMKIK
jgi:hypothetical protein